MSGKGDAPRPIPNPKTFDANWDAIFSKKKTPEKKEPKPKAQIMREMRAMRKEQGLREMRIWVTDEEYAKINSILEN